MPDLGDALTNSIAKDGQTNPTANLPMNSFHHTACSDPTLRNQYATLGLVQDGRHIRVTILSGPNTLTGSMIGSPTAYFSGQLIVFQASADNTGAVTLNINGIGARSVLTTSGIQLIAGDLKAGKFYIALYDGAAFLLNTESSSTLDTTLEQNCVSGWLRPGSGIYPSLSIASPTQVTIPAGSGFIIPPGDRGSENAISVTWVQQTVTLTGLTSSYSTTFAMDSAGSVQQFGGQLASSVLRNYIVVGAAAHVAGTVSSVSTRPAIFGDDGYLARDAVSILSNTLISGGQVTANGSNTLHMDIQGGQAFLIGANAGDDDDPNTLTFPSQIDISFFPTAGVSTVQALTALAPIGSYDPTGAGVVTAIPGGVSTTVIHRLYFLYNSFVWVYGQRTYTDLPTAISQIVFDRSAYKPSPRLSDGALLVEIIARKDTTNLNDTNQCVIINRGGFDFVIGSSGSISEAPNDNLLYGRKNSGWSLSVDAAAPNVTGNVTITKASPQVQMIYSPVSAGVAGLDIQQLGFNWFGLEVTHPDDKAYFRSYNPASGALRFTTTYDLATGSWSFPSASISSAGAFLTIDATSGTGIVNILSVAGAASTLTLRTGALTRWSLGKNVTAEGGSNAGSDFDLISYTDAGAALTTVMRIFRASGNTVLNGAVDAGYKLDVLGTTRAQSWEVTGGSLLSTGSNVGMARLTGAGRLSAATAGGLASLNTFANDTVVELSAGSTTPTGIVLSGSSATNTTPSTIRCMVNNAETLRVSAADVLFSVRPTIAVPSSWFTMRSTLSASFNYGVFQTVAGASLALLGGGGGGATGAGVSNDFALVADAGSLYLQSNTAGGRINFAPESTAVAFVNANGLFPWTDNTKQLGTTGNIWSAVYATSHLTASALKYKTDIVPAKLGLSRIARFVDFTRRSDGSPSTGIIAEEMDKYRPEYVIKDELGAANSVDYTAMLCAVMADVVSRLDALEMV